METQWVNIAKAATSHATHAPVGYPLVVPLAIQPIIEFKVDQHAHANPITIRTLYQLIQLAFPVQLC
jgi:hypothetical protein